jgi:hypothetical protein
MVSTGATPDSIAALAREDVVGARGRADPIGAVATAHDVVPSGPDERVGGRSPVSRTEQPAIESRRRRIAESGERLNQAFDDRPAIRRRGEVSELVGIDGQVVDLSHARSVGDEAVARRAHGAVRRRVAV